MDSITNTDVTSPVAPPEATQVTATMPPDVLSTTGPGNSAHHEIVEHHHATDDQEPISRVVAMALDDSEYSQHALDWAISNVIRKTDLVVLLNVRPFVQSPGPYGAMYMDFTEFLVSAEEQSRNEAHTLLKSYARQLKHHNIAVKAIAMRGDAREEISRKVDEVNADLLIMGSRGHGLVKRAFLGSVSDYCVRHVHCPVLIVKPTAAQDAVMVAGRGGVGAVGQRAGSASAGHHAGAGAVKLGYVPPPLINPHSAASTAAQSLP
ncbi:hypothetical protein HDU76_003642 [Blyttiomyces sp. JEL0837]|nr:hypothetical protein HDU76_003642 [Blyttiomyces sp. JEL0837]